jgi:hypothetical protein
MSAAIARPIQIQSKPFNGKTITYIKIVHGKKINPRSPISQGKLKPAKAAVTLTGTISQ